MTHTPEIRLESPRHFTFPHWFGEGEEPLFGCLDLPRDRATDEGFIIVPPLGEEKLTTHRGLRFLGGELAARGYAVLRFDLAGTGSSFGDHSQLTDLTRWVESISAAVSHLRGLGVARLRILDFRMSAFITEVWASHAGAGQLSCVESITHWEPVASGKRWLREQQAKFAVTVGAIVDEAAFSALEFHVPRSLADNLGALNWRQLGTEPGLRRILACSPESLNDRFLDQLRTNSDLVIPLCESVPFISPATLIHHVPYNDISRFVDLAVPPKRGADAGLHSSHPSLTTLRREVLFTSAHGEQLRETIELRTERRLLTFVTSSAATPAKGMVIFESTANEPAWGPAYLWVAYARQHAGGGLAFARHDKDNYGESGVIERGTIPVLYSSQSREDAVELARELMGEIEAGAHGADPGRTLMLIGLCSGAWMSVETALELGADSVVLINSTQWSRRRKPVDKKSARKHGLDPDTGEYIRPEAHLSTAGGSARLRKIIKSATLWASRRVPLRLWECAARFGVGQSPGQALKSLADKEVKTTIILSPVDEAHFRKHRGHETLESVGPGAWPTDVEALGVPEGDHSLYRPDSREQVSRLLDRSIGRFRSKFPDAQPGKPADE
ncbi:hypothetical protein [Corynebacterium sanguinis]|uniref:hypothetical protein n=1 Tax=Corynebacterium sanguinis TaxID=2594913 RepID=UPI00223B358C|nr:hypothetical protein [Corynebacterium sanguinis]MCT1598373.1 hypothetical protein [Corynebacterium sanguinis]MCT1629412.1 hypothetical protein [Corynebacterium sanguinis]